MADETFVQSVKIEGLSELISALDRLGDVGKRAFEKIGDGASAATKPLEEAERAAKAASDQIAAVEKSAHAFGASLRNVGSSVSNVVDSIQNMATRTGVLVSAIAGATTALAFFVSKTIDSVDAIQEQADAIGISTDAFQKYKFAAIAGGATAAQFQQGFQRAGAQFRKGLEEQEQALAKFNAALDKNAKNALGANPFFGRDMAKEFEVVGAAAQKLAASTGRPLFQVQQELRNLANGGAAARAEFEKLTGTALPPIKGQLERVGKAAEEGGNAFNKLRIPLRDLVTGEARQFEDVIKDFITAISKIEDPMLRNALAADVFGERAGPALATALNDTNGSVTAAIATMERYGFSLDENAIKKAQEAQSKADLLGLALTSLKNKVGLAFAAPFAAGAGGLVEFIGQNQAKLEALATLLSNKLLPIVKDFVLVITGQGDQATNTTWVRDFVSGLTVLYTVIKDKVVFAFNLLLGVSKEVAKVINTIFGTEFTAGHVAAIIAITALTGGFRVLLAVLGTVFQVARSAAAAFRTLSLAAGVSGAGGAVGILAAAFRTFLIPAAIITGIALFVANIDKIKSSSEGVAEALNKMFGTDVKGFEVVQAGLEAIAAALIAVRINAILAGTALAGLGGPLVLAAYLAFQLWSSEAITVLPNIAKLIDLIAIGWAFFTGKISAKEFGQALKDIETKHKAIAEAVKKAADEQTKASEAAKVATEKQIAAREAALKSVEATETAGAKRVAAEHKAAAASVASDWKNAASQVSNSGFVEVSRGNWVRVATDAKAAAKTIPPAYAEAAALTLGEFTKLNDNINKVEFGGEWVKTADGQFKFIAGEATKLAKIIPNNFKEATDGSAAELKKLETASADTGKAVAQNLTQATTGLGTKIDESAKKTETAAEAAGRRLDELTQKINASAAAVEHPTNRSLFDQIKVDVQSLIDLIKQIPSVLSRQPGQQGGQPDVIGGGASITRRTQDDLDGGQGFDPAAGTVQTQASTAGMNALTTATNIARQALEAFKQFVVQTNDCLALLGTNLGITDRNLLVLQEETRKSGESLNTAKNSATGFSEAIAGINTAMGSLDLTSKFEGVAQAIGTAVDTITGKFKDLIAGVEQAATAMASAVSSALDTVIQKLDTAIAKAKELAAAQASSGGGGGGSSGPGMVTGGIARGPGGIDNVPAWLTRGEWVINKESSRRYHGILRAINDGTFRMPKFNMGGLVSGALSSLTPASPRLAFAGGGEVDSGPMTRIELALPGGRVVQVQGRRSAVNEINDFALRRKAASAGRHPRGG